MFLSLLTLFLAFIIMECKTSPQILPWINKAGNGHNVTENARHISTIRTDKTAAILNLVTLFILLITYIIHYNQQ